jgi:hypothetical protein
LIGIQSAPGSREDRDKFIGLVFERFEFVGQSQVGGLKQAQPVVSFSGLFKSN